MDLRASLAAAAKRVVGIVDPTLPGAVASWDDHADATIISVSSFLWLHERASGRSNDFEPNKLMFLVATVGELLDLLSLDQRPLGFLFSPDTVRHAGSIMDLAAEGQGYTVFPPHIAALLPNDGLRRSMVAELTLREREVLRQLGLARSNREIASDLRMSEGYVKIVVRSILIKLRLKNRTSAAVFAVRHGYATEIEE